MTDRLETLPCPACGRYPASPPSHAPSRDKWVIVAVLALAIIGVAAVLCLGGAS